MEEILISVALCTYNGQKYIRQQLDSILSQTHQNLEVIIVDDCSVDDTFNIISDYAQKDSRIRCFKNEVNIGFNKNFEQAIQLTTAGYIAISDQDDIWLPEKLEILLNGIGERWLVFSNSSYISEDGSLMQDKILNTFSNTAANYKSMLLGNFVTGHTMLFAREFLNYFLPIPPEGFYDWWMGFIAFYHHKAIYVDKVLTQYRVHPQSVIQKVLSKESGSYETTCSMLRAFSRYKNLTDDDHAFISELQAAFELKSRHFSFSLFKMVRKYYPVLFPDQKHRQSFSRLNFAFRFSKKVIDQ